MAELEGQSDLMRQLAQMVEEIGAGSVEIGFFDGEYPGGKVTVPQVAIWNEFGVPSNNQPPRPFFRNMISEKQSSWPGLFRFALQSHGMDGNRALGFVGKEIRAQVQESIREFTNPDIKQVTKDKKGFVTPLQDTKIMVNSVTYKVNE